MRMANVIVLDEGERQALRRLADSTNVRLSRRARIVLLAAEGLSNKEIAVRLEIEPHTVGRWRTRFSVVRVMGVKAEAKRSGRPRRQGAVAQKIRKFLQSPRRGSPTSSIRALAKRFGVSHMFIYRIVNAMTRHNMTRGVSGGR